MTEIFAFPTKSISGVFWASLLAFSIPILNSRRIKAWYIFIPIALFLTVLLVISNSRAGWLGCLSGLAYIAYRYLNNPKTKKGFIEFAVIFLAISFCFLLFYKLDSSSGRKHIYSISTVMLLDKWVHGIGLGKFKSKFNEYQADYFAKNSLDNKRALLADNTFYAFNDYLQWSIETGIVGILFLAMVLYFTIRRIIYLHKDNLNKPMLVSATAALICIAVASLFSYPLQVIPIQGLVLICLGVIAFYPDKRRGFSTTKKGITFSYRGFVMILALIFINNAWNVYKRKQIEKEAFEITQSGYKTEAIARYKVLIEKYPETGYNWFLYSQQLYYSNRLVEAMKSLNTCRLFYVDNKLYKLKADIEQELNMYPEAEKSYLRAIYMVPNRMSSRVDLLNFYVVRNDTPKAIYWARSILNMPIKVPSDRVDNMLRETKSILEKLEK